MNEVISTKPHCPTSFLSGCEPEIEENTFSDRTMPLDYKVQISPYLSN